MKSTDVESEAGLAAIDELPRSIEPAHDLWPAISAALPERSSKDGPDQSTFRRGWGLGAVAASVAVAFLAGLLFGRQTPPSLLPEQTSGISMAEVAAPSMVAALEAVEMEYAAAYRGFRPLKLQPSVFEPQTADALRDSWAEMQQAEVALKRALDEHPENPFLSEKLLDLRAQQLEFMRQLHMLDQHSRRTT